MNFDKIIEKYKDDLIESTRESIKIKSVEEKGLPGKPFGEGPYRALENILNIGKKFGFKTKNLDGYAGYIEFGEGDKTLGILGHVDVVPEGEGWDMDPYSAEIIDNKIYGRGAIDDKGPTIAALYAMKAVQESSVELNKKVRLIVGANEETDWRCMDYYFKHEEEPEIAFTPDADFPVIYAEKGVMSIELRYRLDSLNSSDLSLLELKSGSVVNIVPEKANAKISSKNLKSVIEKIKSEFEDKYDFELINNDNELEIITLGRSAHGSKPQLGFSAIHALMDILSEVFDSNDSISNFIKLYNQKIGFYNHGEEIGCKFEDEVVGKLTFNPGVLKLVENEIILSVDIRYPIKYTSQDVIEGISKNIEGSGFTLKLIDDSLKPLYVEKDSHLVKTLMDVYKSHTGVDNASPLTIGGATYARVMDNAVAFGALYPGMEELAHQKNEYISIEHLLDLAKIYAKAIYELCK